MVRIFWKVQVSGLCFFFSSRKRDVSRKINLNIFNVEEDVKVRYILEFNYTVCIYIYVYLNMPMSFFDGSRKCGSLQSVN